MPNAASQHFDEAGNGAGLVACVEKTGRRNKALLFELNKRPDSDYAGQEPLRHRDARSKKLLVL